MASSYRGSRDKDTAADYTDFAHTGPGTLAGRYLRLFWQPNRRINLDNPGILAWMYETVLTESVSVQELRTWLHGPTLIRLWPKLFVPRGVRQAWEERHPVLRAQAAV